MSRSRKKRLPPPGPKPPILGARRPSVRIVAALLLLILAVAGWYAVRWLAAPGPPAVAFADADPAVVEVVAAARRHVWWRPRSAAAWGRLGQLLRAHGYRSESVPCFAEAGRLDPAEPRWPYLEGLGLQTHDLEAALGPLRRAAELCQGTPDAPELTLAEVSLLLGQFDDAERAFGNVLRQAPDNARAHLGLGRPALARGDPRAALPHLDRAAGDPLTRQAALVVRAQARHQLGDDQAGDDQARAAELPADPPWPDPFAEEVRALMAGKQARLSRLRALSQQGRTTEARALARQLEADYPDVYWLVEGREQLHQGNLAAAAHAFQQAAQLAPDSVDAQFDLGTVLLRQQQYPAAAACFRRVTEREPGYGPAYQMLGRCRLAQGDRAAAAKAFRDALRYAPHDAEAHRELGDLLAREGKIADALVHLRRALHLDPTDVKARELLDEVSRRGPAKTAP